MSKGLIRRVARLIYRIQKKLYPYPRVARVITNQFHRLYYYSRGTWKNTSWLGTPLRKCPLDLWIYQEIIHEVKPDVIIECGTFQGGSALFFANICDLVGNGRVLTIDIREYEKRPKHERVTFLVGSSTSEEIVKKVRNLVEQDERVMVVLDSDHSMHHVLNEMRIYGEFVTPGSYLIVEDTNINGHPVRPQYDPGPMGAVRIFLKENEAFAVDAVQEKFYLTFNPNGYLKRIT
jgi:cephalosporin hydroxylase